MKASWNGQIIAESGDTIEIEGYQYFPPDSVKMEYFKQSKTTSRCPWKGDAIYYHIEVDGETNSDAAWSYPEPLEKAQHIKGYIAFWNGVEVTE